MAESTEVFDRKMGASVVGLSRDADVQPVPVFPREEASRIYFGQSVML